MSKEVLKSRNGKAALGVALLFFMIEFIVLLFHEPWRDELEPWTIALKSHSFKELFFLSRYEGFPKLWFIILFIIQLFTTHVLGMQIVHLCFAVVGVFVFNYFSPFHWIKNILFSFGYFFAYEYSIISRYYSIEMLLLFLILGLFTRYHGKYFLLISVLFFILMQDSIYSVIICLCLYPYMILFLHQNKLIKRGTLLISILLFISGIVVSIYSAIPPHDAGTVLVWKTSLDVSHSLAVFATLTKSYFPMPRLIHTFWDSNMVEMFPHGNILYFLISCFTLGCVTLLFYKNKKILILFFSMTMGLLLFYYVMYFGYIRHHGQLYIVFVICYWLYFWGGEKETRSSGKHQIFKRVKEYFIYLVLSVQVMALAASVTGEIILPFSNAKSVAEYIESNSMASMPMVGDMDAPVSSVSCFLKKDIYFPMSKKWGTYIIWDNTRKLVSEQGLINEVDLQSKQLSTDLLLILSYPIKTKPDNWKFIKSFEGAIVYDENYYLYKIVPVL